MDRRRTYRRGHVHAASGKIQAVPTAVVDELCPVACNGFVAQPASCADSLKLAFAQIETTPARRVGPQCRPRQQPRGDLAPVSTAKIGRASCRERVETE